MKHARSLPLALASALLALCVGHVTSAEAHGGEPLPREVYGFEDGSWLLVTNFGVIRSDQPRRYVCEEVFLGSEDFLVAPLSRDTWLTFSRDAISRTEDGGCSFTRIATLSRVPAAVAAREGSGKVVYLSGEEGDFSLYVSEDRGVSFEARPIEVSGEVQWTGVAFLSEEEVLLSGYWRDATRRGEAVWLRHDLMKGGSEVPSSAAGKVTYPYLFDARLGELAAIANVEQQLSLLWGTPEEAWAAPMALESWPADLSIERGQSPRRLWIASATSRGGFAAWTRGEAQPKIFSPEEPVACVESVGVGEALVCGRGESLTAALSRFELEGERRTTLVELSELQGPISGCEAQSATQRTCDVVWPELARALRITLPAGEEMGNPGGGGGDEEMGGTPEEMDMGGGASPDDDMAGGMKTPSRGDDGCNQVGFSSSSFDDGLLWGLICGLSLLGGVRRRRAVLARGR